tara:strand:+ start:761 stop:1327 length:567 start_codon:yes stop_codon:yes gene_type:complete
MNQESFPTEELRRQRILNAALELFSTEGFHAVPVPRIAEKAGVGIGSIYRVAPSKIALADSVFEYCVEQLRQAVFQPVDFDGLSREEIFWLFWQRASDWLMRDPEPMRFMVLYRFVGPPNRKSGLRRVGDVEAILGVAVKQGWIRNMDFDDAAAIISGPLMVLTLDNALTAENLKACGEAVWRAVCPE